MELELFNQDKFNHAVKLAETLAKSTIVPQHFRGKGADVFAAIVLGSELGFSPMQSLNAIVMIQGNATMKAQTQLALVRAKCPKAIIKINVDEEKKIAVCEVKRDENDFGYTATWDMNKAKLMGLACRDNWIKQPTTMLRWRALSEALRTVFPDVLQGLYATEELEELPPIKNEEQPFAITITKEDMDKDFPIPDHEKVVGDLYRIQNGKFRQKQLKDISPEELEEYLTDLELRKTPKQWEVELAEVLKTYLEMIGA